MNNFIKASLISFLISAPFIIYAQDTNEAVVKDFTIGRAMSVAIGVLALISLVIGWRAKLRANNIEKKGAGAIVAIILGLISVILSIIHLYTSASAVFGSGSGKAGAIVALVLGASGTLLGCLALARYRQISK